MPRIPRKIWIPHAGLMIFLVFGALTACQPPATDQFEPEGDVPWPYWPVSMRFHPLTRFVEDRATKAYTLEARVEFVDLDEDITKAYGEMSIRLFELLGTGESGEMLQEWAVNLRVLDKNRSHFDDVTRTYLFRLVVDPEKLLPRMELHGRYISADGRSFDTTFTFER